MSDPIGTYTFLPWVRRGIANQLQVPSTGMRATVGVSVDIKAKGKDGSTITKPIPRTVELYGPGDIVGIEGQISRVEPPHWVTNFEPNYFAFIEFYDEDFPWRYTPAVPNERRLMPWLTLIVLEESEFSEGKVVAKRPLPFIEVTGDFANVFPPAEEGWAWAHAHFNSELSSAVVESDATRASERAEQAINAEPDSACSRLICPRKLKPKTAYHAFLIPTFESGRLAGLAHDDIAALFSDAANGLSPTSSAWEPYAAAANRPAPTHFPVYHRWYFRTAERGDFESLVRLLQPKVVDSRVGRRALDVTDPAPNIVGIENPELAGILKLGGALQAPLDTLDEDQQSEYDKYDLWDASYPEPFQRQLAAFVNLSDSYQSVGTSANQHADLDESIQNDVDPLVAPPIYGRWHALTERLLTERNGTDVPNRDNWVHKLNLDPRWRTAAGFGTKVIQETQEAWMEAAWAQVGDVLEANQRIRQAQLAKKVGNRLYQTHVVTASKASVGRLMMLASPVKARIVSEGVTVHHLLRQSPMSLATTSAVMRRSLRRGGRIAQQLGIGGLRGANELVSRANTGDISAAPPKQLPDGLLTPDELSDAAQPSGFFAALGRWLREHSMLALAILAVLLVVLFLLMGLGVAFNALLALAVVTLVTLWNYGGRVAQRAQAANRIREENLAPEAVDQLPASASFTLQARVDPRSPPAFSAAAPGDADSVEAANFKTALREQYEVIRASREVGRAPELRSLDLEQVGAGIVASLDPELTVPRWVLAGLDIPARIREQMGASFVEVMAYPEFDAPMYEPLARAGSELFVPNLHLVEPDSVTLLETNQKFIEAYMVGLNHEFARELLWREYPTDQRGSYFRQFWDVRKKLAEATDKEAARERLKDIKPLHRWPKTNQLGKNDNREAGQVQQEELVLVIRGELLKKYPNTIISAQPAKWQLTGGRPDKSKERELDESVEPISPLYEARVAPDIYFFGFDLTVLQARGDDSVDDKPGWFFRIEEVPGDARFGFDISREAGTEINVCNDLSWLDIAPGVSDGDMLRISNIPSLSLIEPSGSENEKHDQWESDRQVPIGPNISAAELAYVSLQAPVVMAIHASELLPKPS